MDYNIEGQGQNLMKYLKDQDDFSSLIAEVQISYSHKVKTSDQIKVTTSADCYKHVLPLWKDIDYRESFAILLLSRANKILGLRWISTGGTSSTIADLKLIFQAALKGNATSIIAIHNHPSGQLSASEPDKNLTRKIKDVGTMLDITLMDHVIISSDGYYSMADEGII